MPAATAPVRWTRLRPIAGTAYAVSWDGRRAVCSRRCAEPAVAVVDSLIASRYSTVPRTRPIRLCAAHRDDLVARFPTLGGAA
jgi:hypothetical protein